MITVALDESGEFENVSENSKCMFLGGVIFKYTHEQNKSNELNRIKNFLITACTNNNARYPNDLHYNSDNTNVAIVNKVKQYLLNNLFHFLLGTGPYEQNPPEGTYYLYSFIGDRTYNIPNVGNLLDLNVGTNRYEQMVISFVDDFFTKNFIFDKDEYDLHFATRTIPRSGLESILQQTGHEHAINNTMSYRITTPDSYRTALKTLLPHDESKNFSLTVESIVYETNDKEKRQKQGFLYLSDIVCSYFRKLIINTNTADEAVLKLFNSFQNSNTAIKDKILLWTFGEIDNSYKEICAAYQENDYFTALLKMYNVSPETFKSYNAYEKIWFNPIRNLIEHTQNKFFIKAALRKIEKALKDARIDVPQSTYIFDSINKAISNNSIQDSEINHLLSKIGFIIANHSGQYQIAINMNECLQNSENIELEELRELRNKRTVALLDENKFKEALLYTIETRDYEKKNKDNGQFLLPGKTITSKYYGKTLSQLGQCYAFLGQYDEASLEFIEAVNELTANKAELKKTLSYYLHVLIENNDKQEYDIRAEQYFGTKNFKEQLDEILKVESLENKFALYVYMKALYFFHREEIDLEYFNCLSEKIQNYTRNKQNDHPWEFIYKYLALIGKYLNSPNVESLKEKARTCISVPSDSILEIIVKEISIQVNEDVTSDPWNIFAHSSLKYMYR